MFNHKSKNKIITSSQPAVDQDFIVHNMPSQKKATGSVFSLDTPSSKGFTPTAPKHNFQTIGLVIILGGLLLIGGLVYASYSFIIKPGAGKNELVESSLIDKNKEKVATTTPEVASSSPEEKIDMAASTSELLVASSSVWLGEATSTATTTMSEELTGKDGRNLPPLTDLDDDGLKDDEENLLGTDLNLTDSDADSYSDAAELLGGYNPAGQGKLNTNVNLIKYSNSTFNYEVLVPKNWLAKALNNEATVVFGVADDSLLQVSVQDNSDQVNILSWYEESFPNVVVTYDKLKNTDNWDGIWGEDGLNFYLTDKNHEKILVISYIPAVDNRIAYPSIFKAIINSLIIK